MKHGVCVGCARMARAWRTHGAVDTPAAPCYDSVFAHSLGYARAVHRRCTRSHAISCGLVIVCLGAGIVVGRCMCMHGMCMARACVHVHYTYTHACARRCSRALVLRAAATTGQHLGRTRSKAFTLLCSRAAGQHCLRESAWGVLGECLESARGVLGECLESATLAVPS